MTPSNTFFVTHYNPFLATALSILTPVYLGPQSSSVSSKLGGPKVGDHPQVKALMAGAFRARPPRPKYGFTWSIEIMLSYINCLPDNNELPHRQRDVA